MAKNFENEAVSRAKQTYSQLVNAYYLFQKENSCQGVQDCFSNFAYNEVEAPFEPIISKLRVAKKICTTKNGGRVYNVDWLPLTRTKNLSGNNNGVASITSVSNDVGYDNSQTCFYLLENGVTISVTTEGLWQAHFKYISFDINGKKPPNQTGVDTFSFAMIEDVTTPEFRMHPWTTSVVAAGMCNQSSCREGGKNIEERHPLTYVIKYSKLPDLKKVKEALEK